MKIFITIFIISSFLISQTPCENPYYLKLLSKIEESGMSSLTEREFDSYNRYEGNCVRFKREEKNSKKNSVLNTEYNIQNNLKVQSNPCDDQTFTELKYQIEKNGLSSLSDRDWKYFQLKSGECSEYQKNNKIEKKNEEIEEALIQIEKQKLAQENQRIRNQEANSQRILNILGFLVFLWWINDVLTPEKTEFPEIDL